MDKTLEDKMNKLIEKYEEVVSTGKMLKGKVETTIDYLVGEEPVETKKIVGAQMYAKVEGDTVYLIVPGMCCGEMPFELLAGAEKLPELHGKKMVIFYSGCSSYSRELKKVKEGTTYYTLEHYLHKMERQIDKMGGKIAAEDQQYPLGGGCCTLQLVGSFELIKKKFAPVSITAVHIEKEYKVDLASAFMYLIAAKRAGEVLPGEQIPKKILTGKITIDEVVEVV